MKKYFLVVLCLCLNINGLFAETISESQWNKHVAHWKKHAPWCELSNGKWITTHGYNRSTLPGIRFASKHNPAGNQCNDGDSVLFNGLLCASGEKTACNAVKASQSESGEFWRSPRKSGGQFQNEDSSSFSRDHMLGVMLYLVSNKDIDLARKWWKWIEKNKYEAKLSDGLDQYIQDAGMISAFGGRRVCSREATKYATCPVMWDSLGLFHRVWKYISIPVANSMRDNAKKDQTFLDCALYLIKEPNQTYSICSNEISTFIEIIRAVSSNTAEGIEKSLYAKPGPTRHLYGVQIYLRRLMNDQSEETKSLARALSSKHPENAFFSYLTEESSEKIKSLAISSCPSPDKPTQPYREWSWERVNSADAGKKSMMWDCLFIANLIN